MRLRAKTVGKRNVKNADHPPPKQGIGDARPKCYSGSVKNLIKATLRPIFWIVVIQLAWTVSLILWILSFVQWKTWVPSLSWGVLVLGILLFVLVLAGVIALVIHFARQVSHTRAVKDFISHISHDLRSPLATIRLHLETVRLQELTEAQRQECLDAAIEETERLESNIQEILTASRIERSRLRISAETLELNVFLAQYFGRKEKEVRLKGGTLHSEALPPLKVRADSRLLQRALDNLIENALLHGRPGVQIRLTLEEQARCAVISIADNGPGLPRQELRRVFRMFYRSSNAMGVRKGAGLGLFIVKGITQAHGGRAWVDSEGSGRGCRFRLAIPLLPS